MIYLRTFGALTLENGGLPFIGAGAQRSRLALLAVVAAAGDRGISRESLLAIFWPESDTDSARGALKQALYALRRDLREQELISGNGELILNPSVIQSDVQEFSRALERRDLEGAVALYRGKFLEGVHLHGGEFDRWLDQQRQHFDGLYQEALDRLARSAESRADFPEAVRWWRALAAADRLSAGVARSLMGALARMGDGAAALRYARIYEQFVRSELDTAPDESVPELAARISSDLAAASRTATVSSTPLPGPRPAVPAASPKKRRWLGIGIGLAAAAATIWAVAVGRERGRIDPDGVLLIARAGDREIDSLLLAELAGGLVERDGSLHVSVARAAVRSTGGAPLAADLSGIPAGARAARARYVVEVSSAVESDSLRLTAKLTDGASETSMGPVDPVVVASRVSGTGARLLRDRVAVRLAAHRDPSFRNWSYTASLPHSWESYQQLALGIRTFVNRQDSAARSHLQMAAVLDSASATPLLWEAFVAGECCGPASSDSILLAAERSPGRFGEWERALTELLRARNRHDLPGAHAAGHKLLEVSPGSEWALLVARDVLGLGRAREAAELGELVSRNPGWTRDWAAGVITRDQAYHSLGDYRRELEVVREALRREPDSRLWLQSEVKALAGLGRIAELDTICKRAISLKPEAGVEWWPCDQALLELASHGHMGDARSLARRLLPAREKEIAGIAMNGALARAETFATVTEWAEVESALRAVPAGATGDREYLELLSLAQAFRGNRPGVEQTLHRIDSLTARMGDPYAGGDAFHRAGVAALLGDRDVAVDLLAKAFREGFARIPLHWAGPFDGMRRYPPFDALAHPVEDPAHLSEVLRHWPRPKP